LQWQWAYSEIAHLKQLGATQTIIVCVFKELHGIKFKAPVLQILLENHELCKYAKISFHIHIIVDLNKNIG